MKTKNNTQKTILPSSSYSETKAKMVVDQPGSVKIDSAKPLSISNAALLSCLKNGESERHSNSSIESVNEEKLNDAKITSFFPSAQRGHRRRRNRGKTFMLRKPVIGNGTLGIESASSSKSVTGSPKQDKPKATCNRTPILTNSSSRKMKLKRTRPFVSKQVPNSSDQATKGNAAACSTNGLKNTKLNRSDLIKDSIDGVAAKRIKLEPDSDVYSKKSSDLILTSESATKPSSAINSCLASFPKSTTEPEIIVLSRPIICKVEPASGSSDSCGDGKKNSADSDLKTASLSPRSRNLLNMKKKSIRSREMAALYENLKEISWTQDKKFTTLFKGFDSARHSDRLMAGGNKPLLNLREKKEQPKVQKTVPKKKCLAKPKPVNSITALAKKKLNNSAKIVRNKKFQYKCKIAMAKKKALQKTVKGSVISSKPKAKAVDNKIAPFSMKTVGNKTTALGVKTVDNKTGPSAGKPISCKTTSMGVKKVSSKTSSLGVKTVGSKRAPVGVKTLGNKTTSLGAKTVGSKTVLGAKTVGNKTAALGLKTVGSKTAALGAKAVGSKSVSFEAKTDSNKTAALDVKIVGSKTAATGIKTIGSKTTTLGLKTNSSKAPALGAKTVGNKSSALSMKAVGNKATLGVKSVAKKKNLENKEGCLISAKKCKPKNCVLPSKSNSKFHNMIVSSAKNALGELDVWDNIFQSKDFLTTALQSQKVQLTVAPLENNMWPSDCNILDKVPEVVESYTRKSLQQRMLRVFSGIDQRHISSVLRDTPESLSTTSGRNSRKRRYDEESVRSSVRQSECAFRYKEIVVRKHENYIQIILVPSSSKQNALTIEAMKELKDAIISARKDSNCKAVLFNSSGSFFCSGIDLQQLQGSNKKHVAEELAVTIRDLILTLALFPKPLVAAVNGYAVGLGVTILTFCDIVLSSDKALFCIPATRLGYIPEGGAMLTLPQVVGSTVAIEMLLQCRNLTAEQALKYGLVSEIIWPTRLMEEVVPRILSLVEQPLHVMEATKMMVRCHLWEKLAVQLNHEWRILPSQWLSAVCQQNIKKQCRNKWQFA